MPSSKTDSPPARGLFLTWRPGNVITAPGKAVSYAAFVDMHGTASRERAALYAVSAAIADQAIMSMIMSEYIPGAI